MQCGRSATPILIVITTHVNGARGLNFDPFKPFNEKEEQLVQILGASIHLITGAEGWPAWNVTHARRLESSSLTRIPTAHTPPPSNAMISFTERMCPEQGSDILPAHWSHSCASATLIASESAGYFYNYTTLRGTVAIIECPARDWFPLRRKQCL